MANGTVASFLPAGSTTPIVGTIVGGNFVPDAGQVIPAGATLGPATGVLSSPGVTSVNVPTNFVAPAVAPAAPVITTTAGSPASSTTPVLTNNPTPVISGTGVAGDLITLKDAAGTTICTATVSATSTWSCTPTSPLAPGTYDFTATQKDPVTGLTSPATPVAKVTVDTVAPSAPIVTSPITGTTTTNPLPVFVGTGEAGAKITIKDEAGNTVCTTIVTATGTWTCPFTVPQTEGKHTYLVFQTDIAGNPSANFSPIVITFDIDTDSAPLLMENAAPNAGDNNGDGIKDSTQGNVATKPDTANGNLYTSLDLSTSTCGSISNFDFTPEAPLTTQDVNYDYPIGLFIFKAKCATPGETLNITFVLDKIYNTSTWIYRKYNTVTQTYVNLPGVTYGTRLVGGVSVTTISFSVVEGGPYDEDGIANGEFSDPSGPAINVRLGSFNGTVTGVVGTLFPSIPLTGGSIPNGTPATFTPAGSATIITGTIVNNVFVPTPGQIIPLDATTGPATGTLTVPGATPPSITVATNFSKPTANAPTGNGTVIVIPAVSITPVAINASISANPASNQPIAINNQANIDKDNSKQSPIQKVVYSAIDAVLPRTGGFDTALFIKVTLILLIAISMAMLKKTENN